MVTIQNYGIYVYTASIGFPKIYSKTNFNWLEKGMIVPFIFAVSHRSRRGTFIFSNTGMESATI